MTRIRLKNTSKYCKYHEDYSHTNFECRELEKALNKLTDQEQLNYFLRQEEWDEHDRHNFKERKGNDDDWDMEVITTAARGVDERELNTRY